MLVSSLKIIGPNSTSLIKVRRTSERGLILCPMMTPSGGGGGSGI